MSERALIERPLSYSQMTEFLTCRYRWFLKYVLNVRPLARSTPMELGDAVHTALAAFLAGGDLDAGFAEWRAKTLDAMTLHDDERVAQVDDILATAQAVAARAVDGLREQGFYTLTDADGVAYVERSFQIPVEGWLGGMVIKLDWIAYDPLNARTWVCDFKTRSYFTTEEDEWANLQNTMYQAGALIHGIDSIGTLTIQVNSTPPKQPKMNKDGSMSRAAAACDWDTYRDALLAADLDPADYVDMRDKLGDKNYFAATPVIRSHESIERVWNTVVEPVAQEMNDAFFAVKGFDPASATMYEVNRAAPRFLSPRVCNQCGVRSLCHAQLKGYDVLNLFETAYEKSPRALAYFEAHGDV
jgi:hypothetical protein